MTAITIGSITLQGSSARGTAGGRRTAHDRSDEDGSAVAGDIRLGGLAVLDRRRCPRPVTAPGAALCAFTTIEPSEERTGGRRLPGA